ncbi:nucleotidyltransferase [Clostridium sp.]|uniref:nucleotidyltransferase n=1 Tax=Clostridium sp. TaxID=1506 RepID=UPI002FC82138
MNVAGIVVEYNPLHNGHVYHIQKTRELTNCDVLIAVMSGNFNQRGIPSVIDKWNKTLTALHNGVDLVIELPVVYSLSSAEFFSFGAISLLNNLGVVNSLCFGSEYGEINLLDEVAEVLTDEPLEFKLMLKSRLDEGLSYPRARTLALLQYIENSPKKNMFFSNNDLKLDSHLNSSNNILGIEYIKSLKKLKSNINPMTITRQGSDYNCEELTNTFSSATSIRKFLKKSSDPKELNAHVPIYVYELLEKLNNSNYSFAFDDAIFPYVKYKSFINGNGIKHIPDASEGLHSKLLNALSHCSSLSSTIEEAKSKRYTYTRINRILCQYFVGFDTYDTEILRKEHCPYAKVLGFNERGKSILKSIKQNSSIPLYTKVPKDLNDTLKLDIQATKAYSLINRNINYNDDYLISPLIIK